MVPQAANRESLKYHRILVLMALRIFLSKEKLNASRGGLTHWLLCVLPALPHFSMFATYT